ncbi:MAG TPA: vanadium-dependent haloperoxidase [Caldimonas sp.]|nr:vanadium-dependent haloperoxidase [Caldimonas sp.]
MKQSHRIAWSVSTIFCAASALFGCGGGDDPAVEPVTITVAGPNAVSQWNETATTTINQPAQATGTPEERLPNTAVDLATMHVAIYDAIVAITGTHRPYAITPTANATGASQEAAVAAAAYGVLFGLFPSRTAQYQAAYDAAVAAIPAGTAKTQGLAVGAEVAAGILALRANDGRSVALAPFVPGTSAGEFRGVNPVGRANAFIKPFSLTTIAQFRAPGPPALTSAAYAADVNETKALGAATSTTRTADQTELARFNTESPATLNPRTMRTFAMTNRSIADQARLMAIVWVTQADAGNACFESKYHYLAWRPSSAITLDGDNNAATVVDATWTPVVGTPNHPEYPAAHSCITASMAEVLSRYYGTVQVSFDINSLVTGTTRRYRSTSAWVDEVQVARIAGGMHFRFSTVDGAALGRNVADWVLTHYFQAR